jgi:hypothetical protein
MVVMELGCRVDCRRSSLGDAQVADQYHQRGETLSPHLEDSAAGLFVECTVALPMPLRTRTAAPPSGSTR